MKRDIIKMLALTFVVLFLCPGIAGWYETHYEMEGRVINIDVNGDVVFEDTTGNIWAVQAQGFKVGDEVKATFSTNYTDGTRKDDAVEKLKKR